MKKQQFIMIASVTIAISLIGADCSWLKKTAEDVTNNVQNAVLDPVGESDKKKIDEWIAREGLNEYGDPKDTVYAGGSPLFDEKTGKTTDRYVYIITKHSSLVSLLKLSYPLK